MSDKASKAWVVSLELGRFPQVCEYTCVRVNEHSITVKNHGRTEVIKEASHRVFFTDQERMREYVRARLVKLVADWKARIEKANQQIDGEVVAYVVRPDMPPEWGQPVKLTDDIL